MHHGKSLAACAYCSANKGECRVTWSCHCYFSSVLEPYKVHFSFYIYPLFNCDPWLFHTWLFPSEFSYWTDFFLFFFFNLETLLMRTTKPHRLIININRLQVYFIRSVLWAVMVSGVLCHMTLQIRWGNNYLIICWICKVAHFQRNYIFLWTETKYQQHKNTTLHKSCKLIYVNLDCEDDVPWAMLSISLPPNRLSWCWKAPFSPKPSLNHFDVQRCYQWCSWWLWSQLPSCVVLGWCATFILTPWGKISLELQNEGDWCHFIFLPFLNNRNYTTSISNHWYKARYIHVSKLFTLDSHCMIQMLQKSIDTRPDKICLFFVFFLSIQST